MSEQQGQDEQQQQGIPFSEEEANAYNLRRLELIDEIKALAIQKKGNITLATESDFITKLEDLSIAQLEAILFNNKIKETAEFNDSISDAFFTTMSTMLASFIGDEELKKDLEGDKKLRDATNMVVNKRIGWMPDEVKVIALSSKHIATSVKRKAAQVLENTNAQHKKQKTDDELHGSK